MQPGLARPGRAGPHFYYNANFRANWREHLHMVGRRPVGALNDTTVEFMVELKEPEPKPFLSIPVGTGTFNLERSALVSRTRPRRR